MDDHFFIQTPRIGLRKYWDADLDAFAALNSDPEVMRYFPNTLSVDQCRNYIARINNQINEQGYGFWAAEHLKTAELMGFVGITNVSYETEFTPAVEIGWRLAKKFWGRGLATEAALACLDFAFEKLKLPEIVSFTAVTNERSYKLMERIGMRKKSFFNHPKIEEGDPLQRHVLYKITLEQIRAHQLKLDGQP